MDRRKKDEVIKGLREELTGNKKMIRETQDQVQLIYRWIQKQEEKDAQETTDRIRIYDSQLSMENALTREVAPVGVRKQL